VKTARLLVVLAVVSLVVAGVAACGSSSGGKGGTIEGVAWDVAAYADASGVMTDAPVTVPMDARFDAGKVAGTSGCNQYNGPYTLSGSSLTVGPLASTKMLCDQIANDAEAAYLPALQKAATYTAEGGKLTIFDKDGKEVVRYTEVK